MTPDFTPHVATSGQPATSYPQELVNLRLELHAMKQTLETLRRSDSMLRELLWSQIFHDAIAGCPWLKEKAFSPGRWAAGYPLLYVLFRVLTDAAPNRILELGMGQTTRMIGQYAKHHPSCKHLVVEHSEEWIAFFLKNFSLSDQTSLLRLDLMHKPTPEALGAHPVPAYKDFERHLRGQAFDLILIDGPYGATGPAAASRTDILDLLPECLAPSFVILFDDANRVGEQKTVEMIKDGLNTCGFAHKAAIYQGEKDCLLIASADQRYLCSL